MESTLRRCILAPTKEKVASLIAEAEEICEDGMMRLHRC